MVIVKSLFAAFVAALLYGCLALIYAIGSVSDWQIRRNVAIGVGAIRATIMQPVIIVLGVLFVASAFFWEFQRASR